MVYRKPTNNDIGKLVIFRSGSRVFYAKILSVHSNNTIEVLSHRRKFKISLK